MFNSLVESPRWFSEDGVSTASPPATWLLSAVSPNATLTLEWIRRSPAHAQSMTGVRRVFVLPELLLAIKGLALILILLRWYRVLTVEDCQIPPEPPLRRALSSVIPANQPLPHVVRP